MKKNIKKQVLSGMAGTMMMLSGCAVQPQEALSEETQAIEEAKTQAAQAQADEEQNSSLVKEEDGSLSLNGYRLEEIAGREQRDYVTVSNVEGSFSFNQDVLSPEDEVFNIYGTAITGACAKPVFAFETGEESEELGDHFINVSGSMKHSYSVSLKDLEEKSEKKVVACSCATSKMVVNAMVTGVPLKSVLELADLQADANTITVKGSDGYGVPMPLSYALEKDALIVYKINDKELPEGQATQLWMPDTVARYFTRDVVEIEVTAEDEVPAIEQAEDSQRAKISIMNYADDASFTVGQEIRFEGYADDCGSAVKAVEISLDGGETWTSYETEGATAERWVYWYFGFTPEQAGTYKLQARAVTGDGTVSPLASTIVFQVEENDGV